MKKGVSGLNCLISGIHFNFTFSNESLSYTEKQTTNTSVSEYASVRRRSYVSCKRNQLKINKNVLHFFFQKKTCITNLLRQKHNEFTFVGSLRLSFIFD